MLATLLLAATLHGTWTIQVTGDHTQLNIVRDHSNWGQTIKRSDVPLTDAQINSAGETPVHFTFNRDAGVIDFNGSFEAGEGVGRFTFTPSSNYVTTLRSLGVSSDDSFDDEQLFTLAMFDVGTNFIREMQSLGLHENLETYKRFKIHGVTADFVRNLRSLGYDNLSADNLVRFRIHGVSPDFIREMHDAGFKDLTADDLVRFRIHGATPDFVRSMRELGVRGVDADSVVKIRIHGVSTDFVRELRDLGYTNVSSDDLVRMRIHGVTTDFIRELARAGYHGVPIDKLVQMRIHGIDPSMLSQSSSNQ